jgi:25S rRNA (adenine2142-N1)-methyltransferase
MSTGRPPPGLSSFATGDICPFTRRSEHAQSLADRVKCHHERLRAQTLEKSVEEVWQTNLNDEASLAEYAKSMYTLATTVWKGDDVVMSRIEWCHRKIQEYFLRGGAEAVRAKDERRKLFHQQHESSITAAMYGDAQTSRMLDQGASDSSQLSDSLPDKINSIKETTEPQAKTPGTEVRYSAASATHVVTDALIHPIRVLDVGSCYNPFAVFADLQVTALDIAPAVPSVARCDFLSVPVTAEVTRIHSSNGDSCDLKRESFGLDGHGFITIHNLQTSSFQVVVFGLLLSYMPCPHQRFACCKKARALLEPGGLLVITSEDSSHVGKAVLRMKAWKRAIESLGFQRWRYEKLPHLHGLVFRAVELPPLDLSRASSDSQEDLGALLFISQDQHVNGSLNASSLI